MVFHQQRIGIQPYNSWGYNGYITNDGLAGGFNTTGKVQMFRTAYNAGPWVVSLLTTQKNSCMADIHGYTNNFKNEFSWQLITGGGQIVWVSRQCFGASSPPQLPRFKPWDSLSETTMDPLGCSTVPRIDHNSKVPRFHKSISHGM